MTRGVVHTETEARALREEDPLVTVVVPAYNHAQYVTECLDSVVGGSYANIELIVVNDASQDETGRVVAEWIERHPQHGTVFLDHKENIGLTKSLNEAIRRAHGKYFCQIAGDDVMLPNGIVERVDYLERHPQKLAVFADCRVIDDKGNETHASAIEDYSGGGGTRKNLLRIDELVPYNIVFDWGLPSGAMFLCRMSTFTEIGPYDERYMVEDYDMYLRLAARGKLGFCDTYVAKFRKHGSNTSTVQREVIRQQSLQMAQRNMRLFGPICRSRLASLYYLELSQKAGGAPARMFYFALHKASLFVSWRSYQVREFIALAKNRRRVKTVTRGTATPALASEHAPEARAVDNQSQHLQSGAER